MTSDGDDVSTRRAWAALRGTELKKRGASGGTADEGSTAGLGCAAGTILGTTGAAIALAFLCFLCDGAADDEEEALNPLMGLVLPWFFL